MGKYEEAKKKAKAAAAKGKSSKVNALNEELTDDEWEDSDDEDILGPAASGARVFGLSSRPMCKPEVENVPPPPVPDPTWTRVTRNGRATETNVEHIRAAWMDAKEDMVNSLSGWAHRTTIKLQSPRRQTLKKMVINSEVDLDRMLRTKCKIAGLAAAATSRKNNPDSKLPDIPLADDEIWALVDSGSTLNAAWIKKHFAAYARFVVSSKQQIRGDVATTAGGHELKHKGRCKVNTMIDDHEMPIVFSNLKVDVPILSVRRMVKLGNDVILTETGGSITNKLTGQKLTFIEADGTYWIKLEIHNLLMMLIWSIQSRRVLQGLE